MQPQQFDQQRRSILAGGAEIGEIGPNQLLVSKIVRSASESDKEAKEKNNRKE